MIILARVAQLLGEVALAGKNHADSRDLLQYLGEVPDPLRAFDHHAAKDLSPGVQGPEVGASVVLLLRQPPVRNGPARSISPPAEGLPKRVALPLRIAHGGHGVIGLLNSVNVRP